MISNNTAPYGGGLLAYPGSTVTLVDSVLFGNSAGDIGGAVYNMGSLSLQGCALFGNTAVTMGGGGVYSDGPLAIRNSTLASISASGPSARGGAVCTFSGGVTTTNSVLWGNTAGLEGAQVFIGGGSHTVTSSDIEGCGGSGAGWNSSIGIDGGGNRDADALFLGVAGGDVRIPTSSPAVDVGSNALLPADPLDVDSDGDVAEALPWDLAKRPRILHGTVDGGPSRRTTAPPSTT